MNHLEIYDEFFEIDGHNPRVCELMGTIKPDIHHIDARGMGGRDVDYIENLMALNRTAHEYFGDRVKYKDFLIEVHSNFIKTREAFVIENRWHPIMQEYLNTVHKIY